MEKYRRAGRGIVIQLFCLHIKLISHLLLQFRCKENFVLKNILKAIFLAECKFNFRPVAITQNFADVCFLFWSKCCDMPNPSRIVEVLQKLPPSTTAVPVSFFSSATTAGVPGKATSLTVSSYLLLSSIFASTSSCASGIWSGGGGRELSVEDWTASGKDKGDLRCCL